MKEEIDFSKYDNRCFLCLESGLVDYKVITYDLSMEKQGTEYVPILLLYICDIFGECITDKRELASKKYFPEYNSNIKEISREQFNNLKNKIRSFSVNASKLKADKLHFYFQCEVL